MTKRQRITLGGYVYHVLNRANGRLRIFHTTGEFLAFEKILAEGLDRVPIRLCGYCLMSNHWHLLLWPGNRKRDRIPLISRKIDPSKVTWLGDNDCIDTWHRPERVKWMSQELYNTLPQCLDIRIVTFNVTSDDQTEPLMVVTTLLDPEIYPAPAIGQLYGYRWCVELDIFSIKQMLNLDHLRCKSPEMMAREFWVTLLAYNMVRWVCAQAACVHGKLARQMSFTIACNTLLSQWLMPPEASIRKQLGQYALLQIASNEVADRPGRIEPRVVKRRLKKYTLMTKPRHQYKPAKDPAPHRGEKVR